MNPVAVLLLAAAAVAAAPMPRLAKENGTFQFLVDAKGARFPLSLRADDGGSGLQRNGQGKSKGQTQNQGGGLTAAPLCFTKRTDH